MPSHMMFTVAWLALIVSFVCAAYILFDIYGQGHRQRMGVMEAVWPVTALYFGVVAVVAYRRWGLRASPAWVDSQQPAELSERESRWSSVATGVAHCGAGCTLGDIIAEFTVFALGLTVAGIALWPEYAADYILALVLGIGFQYFAIAPMRGLGLKEGLRAAAKADVLSLTAFEVGLFGWMALMAFVFYPDPHLNPSSPVYWFLMQIG